MKIRNILKRGKHFSAFLATLLILASCSDTWDDHYDEGLATSNQTLFQLIESNAELSDFMKVLKATHIFNNLKRTNVTYAQLLNNDQTLTVWAPKNGTFNADSLLQECMTQRGDSLVGIHFVGNHISHNLYSMSSSTNETALMLNNKQISVTPEGVGNARLDATSCNHPAKNGLLHLLNNNIDYLYTIYDGLTTLPAYAHIGDFLLKYQRYELDEERSIMSGLVDGEKVYSDSVMYVYNPFISILGSITSEDSVNIMLAPSKEIWQPAFDEALTYFNYGSIQKADSIQLYWTNRMLLQDLFYNRNLQHLSDSIFSGSYRKYVDPEHHVYYKPLEAGGLLSSTYIADSIQGSNGVFYNLRQWPFTPEQIYFWPVKVEGENEPAIIDHSDCNLEYRSAVADSISGGYVRINPRTSASNWTVTYEVANTLAGTYDVCAVILPKTVYNIASRDFKPNKFVATLTYTDENGEEQIQEFTEEVSNNPYCVDTVKIGTITLPVCNYQQTEVTVRLKLSCSISRRENQYSRDTYLDCIYLRPNRKEN